MVTHRVEHIHRYEEPPIKGLNGAPVFTGQTIAQSVDMLQLFRMLMKDEYAAFRNEHQVAAMRTTSASETADFIIVTPTGSGKSLLYMMSALQNPTMTSVVVLPLVSLTADIKRRATEAGGDIRVQCWDWNVTPSDPPQLLLISVKEATSLGFEQWLAAANATKKVARVYVDEAHIVLSSMTYRREMIDFGASLKELVPLTLLTATLPPKMEGEMKRYFLCKQAIVLRTSTVRPNIHHDFKRFPKNSERDAAFSAYVRDAFEHLAANERMIVYATTQASCDSVFQRLQPMLGEIRKYHSDVPEDDRDAVLVDFHSGAARVVVATSGFGPGVDFPRVRHVVHYGCSHSILDYIQESGRAGRDGQMAEAVAFLCESDFEPHQNRLCGDFKTYFSSGTNTCLRQILHAHADGQGNTCIVEPGAVWCSVCTASARKQGFHQVSTGLAVPALQDNRQLGRLQDVDHRTDAESPDTVVDVSSAAASTPVMLTISDVAESQDAGQGRRMELCKLKKKSYIH